MRYVIEAIGAEFSNRDLPALAAKFDAKAAQGYRLHSVFQVTQPGCLGISQASVTYLAVYESTSS